MIGGRAHLIGSSGRVAGPDVIQIPKILILPWVCPKPLCSPPQKHRPRHQPKLYRPLSGSASTAGGYHHLCGVTPELLVRRVGVPDYPEKL